MLQDEQFHIDRQLGMAALGCINSDLQKFFLIAKKTQNGMKVELEPENSSKMLLPSDEVFAAVRDLFLLNDKYKTGLTGMKYTFTQKDDGGWKFESTYTYKD